MTTRKAPDATPEPGWTPIQPFPQLRPIRSFVSGDPDGDRLRVAYFRRERDGALVGRVWFGPGTEGPPGCAHGGSVAAVLDEAMGAAAWMAGHAVVAARLTTNFRRMVPLGSDAILEAWVADVEGRKVTTRARLLDASSEPFADGEGLFVLLEPEALDAMRRNLVRL
jgi:acyl-coenzyme A thioesterase PaaI-like protein